MTKLFAHEIKHVLQTYRNTSNINVTIILSSTTLAAVPSCQGILKQIIIYFQQVRISMNDLNLETPCHYDYIEVRDGPDENSNLIT